MTADDLYQLTPERVICEPGACDGFAWTHIPELCGLEYLPDEVLGGRVQVRVVCDVDFDGRRIWRLATIWFDDAPIMVFQNAGRDGRDHHRRFVTDRERYVAMVGFLAEAVARHALEQEAEYDHDLLLLASDEPCQELTSFYHHELQTVREHSLTARYARGER